MSYKFAAPPYSLLPMALQTVQVSVEPRLSTALKDRSVVPYSSPKTSARLRYHLFNSVVFLHLDACEKISANQAVLKGRTGAIRKENKHQLALFFLLEACQWNAARWSTTGWPANALFHCHSIGPAARSSFQAPSSLSLHALRALDRLKKRRRVGLRAVEVIICMITRDFDMISMTSQASLSLSLLLTKVTSALPIIYSGKSQTDHWRKLNDKIPLRGRLKMQLKLLSCIGFL